MTQTIKLADYLFCRLKQLGIEAIHGVPGDYNLNLLDSVEPAGLLWVGNANELNAGYAADGYARMKGLGALVTTYGVGELSAINAIACAYAERAPVVHIVGTPPRASQEARLMIHHTLGDGEYRHFSQMYSHVTVAQTNLLNPQTAAEQIDVIIYQCILQSRPVYIEVPVDMVAVDVLAGRLETRIDHPRYTWSNLAATRDRILERVYAARQPIILVDSGIRGLDLIDSVQSFVDITHWPTFTTVSGKSLVDMSATNVHGIYRGSFAQPAIKTYFDGSDLVLYFGAHPSSTNTYNWSSVPRPEVTISFDFAGISIFGDIVRDLPPRVLVEQLHQSFDKTKVRPQIQVPDLPRDDLLPPSESSASERIKQDSLWPNIASFLRPGDIVLGETGTAGYGVREMSLPRCTRLFTPIIWLSIGYMLPACQGAALAQRELIRAGTYFHGLNKGRTILLIGDGSFQMTAQELATIVRHNLNVIVFLINNDGYTIERCIHGKDQTYNDVASWRYLRAPLLFGAPEDTYTASAETYGELAILLDDSRLADGSGLRMIEVILEREDAPAGPLVNMLNLQNQS